MKIKYEIKPNKIIKKGDWVIYDHHEIEDNEEFDHRAYLVDKISKNGSILLRYDRLLGYHFHNNPSNGYSLSKVEYGVPRIFYEPKDEKLYKRRLNENKL